MPQVLGGPDLSTNLVAACEDCNSGKGAIPPDAPRVEDVQADVMRWMTARRYAQSDYSVDRTRVHRGERDFVAYWVNACLARDGAITQLGEGSGSAVRRFLAEGFDTVDLYAMVDEAFDDLDLAPGECWPHVSRRMHDARVKVEFDTLHLLGADLLYPAATAILERAR